MSPPLPCRSGIYAIVNTRSGGFYLGSSVDVPGRFRGHRHDLNGRGHRNTPLQRAWKKYGPAAFDFIWLAEISPADLHATEQRLLDRLAPLERCYNISRDATAPHRGKKLSTERRAEISANLRGRHPTPETTARRLASRKGYRHSPETRAKMSRSAMGKRKGVSLTAEQRRAIGAGVAAFHASKTAEDRARLSASAQQGWATRRRKEDL
jgi:group I intron endonuclease